MKNRNTGRLGRWILGGVLVIGVAVWGVQVRRSHSKGKGVGAGACGASAPPGRGELDDLGGVSGESERTTATTPPTGAPVDITTTLEARAHRTDGPQIALRFFQAWSPTDYCNAVDVAERIAKEGGVAMGGAIASDKNPGKTPRFVVLAAKDPKGPNLASLHLVHGVIGTGGEVTEDVTIADAPGAGAASLCHTFDAAGTWDPGKAGYWYVRALEVPSTRVPQQASSPPIWNLK